MKLNHPTAFATLLGRVLPYQINVKTDTKITIEYPTMEEKRKALIERGFDPDVLDKAAQPKFLLELQSNSNKEVAE